MDFIVLCFTAWCQLLAFLLFGLPVLGVCVLAAMMAVWALIGALCLGVHAAFVGPRVALSALLRDTEGR